MTTPVLNGTQQIAAAKANGIIDAETAWKAAYAVGLPFYAACALLEKETWGRNIYGHDKGGVFCDPTGGRVYVTPENYNRFIMRVMNGETSNGVGPCQITYAGPLVNGHRTGGFFLEMSTMRLLPYEPYDNMRFGFGKLKLYHDKYGTWIAAGRVFNGAQAYGDDLSRKVGVWVTRVGL